VTIYLGFIISCIKYKQEQFESRRREGLLGAKRREGVVKVSEERRAKEK